MKKTLLLMIALFTLGHLTKAQTLSSGPSLWGQMLKKQQVLGKKAVKAAAPKSPHKADEASEGDGWWIDATSYYDENGSFVADSAKGKRYAYRANIKLSNDTATITNLVSTEGFTFDATYPIEGIYDAKTKTIKIPTPEYDDTEGADHYTLVGDMTYYGTQCYVALFAGDFAKTANASGQYALNTTDTLVFDVNDDFTKLTPRTSFGAWAFQEYDNSSEGCLTFFRATAIKKMPAEADLEVIPDTVTFDGASATVGAQLKKTVTLVNRGLKATTISANVNANDCKLAAYKSIKSGEKQTIYVMCNPTKSGKGEGTINIMAASGSKATIHVKTDVSPAPDFSKVTKEGDITFSFGDDFPYVITDTITGYPVAVSTNHGMTVPFAHLYANFTVPEGKTGVFSWKGVSKGASGDGINIYVNDSLIYHNMYAHDDSKTFTYSSGFTDDISNTLVLKSGSYKVAFENASYSDFNDTGKYKSWLYDFALQLFDKEAHKAILKVDSLDFGSHYYDKFAVTDTLTATLLNFGTEPLKVTGATNADAFSAAITDATAAYCAELPVRIVYNAEGLGDKSGKVVLHTTGGDLTLACKATNVALPADYNAIVTAGEFSFDTSSKHPFAVDGNKAYNSTAKFTRADDDNGDYNSYLTASFDVPEGKTYKLSWTGHNSSWDPVVLMNNTIITTGTMIYLDGNVVIATGGKDVDVSSSTLKDEQLTFGPGRHSVEFFYKKVDSKPKYDDKLEISNLALTDVATGIEAIREQATGKAVKNEFFTLDGRRTNGNFSGITLVKETDANGHVSVKKMLK